MQRWTKDVDIFDHHLLLVPVHLPGHWCMAVIDFRGKQIRYLDSLGGRNDRCLRGLLEYLVQKMQTRKDCRFETEGWSLETVENIPRQTNNFDCGVFALKFADYAARDLEVNFSQSDMLYFRQRMLFEIAQGKMLGTGYGNVWHC